MSLASRPGGRQRPDVAVRLYLDTAASQPSGGWPPPSAAEVAQHLALGRVFRTVPYHGHPVRNHAKLVIVDHRFVLVTSAKFSYTAAHKNIEFGVKLNNPALAESVERELRNVEGVLYEKV